MGKKRQCRIEFTGVVWAEASILVGDSNAATVRQQFDKALDAVGVYEWGGTKSAPERMKRQPAKGEIMKEAAAKSTPRRTRGTKRRSDSVEHFIVANWTAGMRQAV
ncbi:hypothetical protein cyc_05493 [Cyclospora cayetanensis]|uniref:Uncharacterized protein n=1 Tax=Cyclospora cayetanensis TaxID=88456 RepID=A0A1D3D2M7_9EIME|nr:hypothetical protein cyc_05493 [Cyclospora cayetanensis]